MFPIQVAVDKYCTVCMYENGTARLDNCNLIKRSSVQYLTWIWLSSTKDMVVRGDLKWGLEISVPLKMKEAYLNALNINVANILEEE